MIVSSSFIECGHETIANVTFGQFKTLVLDVSGSFSAYEMKGNNLHCISSVSSICLECWTDQQSDINAFTGYLSSGSV